MKELRDNSGLVVAFVLNTDDYIQWKGKQFFSDPDDSIQIGSLFFKKDAAVSPHLHKKRYWEWLLQWKCWLWCRVRR